VHARAHTRPFPHVLHPLQNFTSSAGLPAGTVTGATLTLTGQGTQTGSSAPEAATLPLAIIIGCTVGGFVLLVLVVVVAVTLCRRNSKPAGKVAPDAASAYGNDAGRPQAA
jgi:hypothetical protein